MCSKKNTLFSNKTSSTANTTFKVSSHLKLQWVHEFLLLDFVEDKPVKCIALGDASVRMFSSDKMDPENLLSDSTKVSGTTWAEIKKAAMEPDYLATSPFVKYLKEAQKETV